MGAALALPGLVSGGSVRQAPNLGWNEVPAQELFADALAALRPGHPALPVASENEANLAALAELWFGGLGDVRSFLYLTGEIGVGGALVLNGELLRGAHGFAGEIGHVVVDPAGPECRCGSRGCLEQYAPDRRRCCGQPGSRGSAAPPGCWSWSGARGRRTRVRWPRSVRRAGCWAGCCRERSIWSTRTRWCSGASTGA